MKIVRFLILAIAAGLVFSSCQKELSFEAGDATGTLKADASGDCLPVIINGTYQKDTLLKSTNSVDVSVDIIATGAYFIKTDTINGYSFSASGNAQTTGATTIHLVGSGRPLVPGVDIFTVKFGVSTCQINVVVTGPGSGGGGGGGGGTAVYSLGGSPGSCTGAILTGTYTQGQPATGTVMVNVTVTTPGTYTITTGAVNGVTFTGSGTLTASTTSITLTASGTAGTTASAVYPLTAGTSNCSFTVTYGAPIPPASYTISCAAAVISGIYQQGVNTSASNTVGISATSAGAGSYSITATAAGITFSGSGTFSGAGTFPVTLTANGAAPNTTGAISFTAMAATGGSNCNFTVMITAAPTDYLRATIDGVVIDFSTNAEGTYVITNDLQLTGDGPAGTDLLVDVDKATFGGGPVTATFYENTLASSLAGGYMIGLNYNTGTTTYAPASILASTPDHFTITIQSISATRVKGIFEGTIRNNFGSGTMTKVVTGGVFDLPIN